MHKTRSSRSETSGSYIHGNRFFSRGRSLLSYPETASDAMFSRPSAPDLPPSVVSDDPIFEVFYLADAHGVIAAFSGNPPFAF